MEQVSIEEARRTLGDLVDRARMTGEPTMITRYGKPGAVLVSADEYQRILGPDGPGTAPEGENGR
jgi:prevent-host-death family protein